MVTENIIVKKYALALFSSTEQLNVTNNILKELNSLYDIIKNNKSVKSLLFNKNVPKKIKFIFCNSILGEIKTSDLLKNFVITLIQRKRFYLLSKIIDYFKDIIDDHNCITGLKVTLANEPDKNNLEKIKKELSRCFECEQIKFDFIYDKSILGGMIINKGSQMLDLSLSSKLKEIELIVKKI